MNRNKIFFRNIIICLIVTILTVYFAVISNATQDVIITMKYRPKVDIVLAKARAKTDVNNFEADIKQALVNNNFDTSDVQVKSVSAEQVDLETSFQWNQSISSSIGSIAITNNGQNVEMKGNQTNPGKNAIWIEPTGNQEQTFTFGYNIDFGDSFKAAGMLLRVKETNKTNHYLSGYMLSFNQSGYEYYSTSGARGAIWKFTYDANHNTTMSRTFVKALNINTSGTLTVSATDSKITINGGGVSNVQVDIDSNYTTGNGYGFFSDHYSHNCSNIRFI